MDTMFWIFVGLFILCTIVVIHSLKSAKQGKLTTLIKFRHIQGMPNLLEGEIVKISTDEISINIENKYSIPKNKVISKTLTNSKMLTEKQKSVIKRSLVGVAVAGPLGMIVGGLSGVGTKQVTETVHFLTINFKDYNDVEHNAMFALEQTSELLYLDIFVRS